MSATPLTLYSVKGSGLLNSEIDGNAVALANQIDSRTGTVGPLSFRNRIINGNFAINQRVVSGTVTLAAGAYGHDRWKAGAAGCTYTFAASGIDTVITITAGSLQQVVESIYIEGGIYALGHEGTAQARIGINGAAPSGAYTAATKAAPIVTGANAAQAVTVEFSTGTVSRVQLEQTLTAAPAMTAFERRLDELRYAQRYYEIVNAQLAPIVVYAAGYASTVPAQFKVTKRSGGYTVLLLSNSAQTVTVSGVYNFYPTIDSCGIVLTTPSAVGTVGSYTYQLAINNEL